MNKCQCKGQIVHEPGSVRYGSYPARNEYYKLANIPSNLYLHWEMTAPCQILASAQKTIK